MTTSFRILPLCTGLAVMALSFGLSSQATTLGTNAIIDSFVTTGPTGNLVGNNYGFAGALGLSAPGSPKGEFQSVMQFDLNPTRGVFNSLYGTGQWSVVSVSLQLTAAQTNNAIFNPTVAGLFRVFWMQNDSWTEGTGTPGSPTTTGITYTSLTNSFIGGGDESLGVFSFDGSTSGAATYTLNLTSGFNADLISGNNISLRVAAADSVVSYLFNSRNFGTSSARPFLTLTVVPEPGIAALGAVGVGLMGWWRLIRLRRRA